MSVQCNQYLGYGYMLKYEETKDALIEKLGEDGYEDLTDQYHDSAFKPEIVEVDGYSMVWDHMSSEFVFFGKVFAKSVESQCLDTMQITETTPGLAITVQEAMLKIFGTEFGTSPQTWLVCRYR